MIYLTIDQNLIKSQVEFFVVRIFNNYTGKSPQTELSKFQIEIYLELFGVKKVN